MKLFYGTKFLFLLTSFFSSAQTAQEKDFSPYVVPI